MSFPISCYAQGDDAELFTNVVSQGIDSRLEAFTESTFNYEGQRLVMDFADSELSILIRRLSELDDAGNDSAGQWVMDIVECEYGHETI